jgi:hypothetical protein
MATRQSPSYSVKILGQSANEPLVITLYWIKLPPKFRNWWYSRNPKQMTEAATSPPEIMSPVEANGARDKVPELAEP